MKIAIDKKKCCWKDGKCVSSSCGEGSCGCGGKACIGCVEACPVGALERKKTVEINSSKCILCGSCIDACKHKAISMS